MNLFSNQYTISLAKHFSLMVLQNLAKLLYIKCCVIISMQMDKLSFVLHHQASRPFYFWAAPWHTPHFQFLLMAFARTLCATLTKTPNKQSCCGTSS